MAPHKLAACSTTSRSMRKFKRLLSTSGLLLAFRCWQNGRRRTTVVRGAAPFQLAIHPNSPLWTPDLLLGGNDHYATLYEDNHTWRELDAAALRFQPAGCARE